jgi:proline iminopeptidase
MLRSTIATLALLAQGGISSDTVLTVGDGVIRARCSGAGTPGVVLLHGARSSMRIWDRLLANWSRPNRVCAWDRPGHGRSGPAGLRDRSWPDMEQELQAVRKALAVTGPWVAVGHSLGGLYARALTFGTEPPAALVLVDPAHEDMRPRLRGLMPETAWTAWGIDLARNGDRLDEIALGDWLRRQGPSPIPAVVLSAGRRTFQPGWDSAAAARIARELHDSLARGAGGALVIAERSGHNVPVDQPELVGQAIDSALALVTRGAATQDPRDQTVRLPDGTAIRLTEFGSGPLLIVAHGGPSLGRRYLVNALLPLARTHHVVIYDQRGAGESGTGPSPEFAYAQLLDDIGSLATVLGEERFALLGHSWGAMLALSYAVREPARVTRLVLVSPTEPGRRFSALQAQRLAARTTPADSAAMRAAFAATPFVDGTVEGADAVFRAMYRPWFGVADSVVNLTVGLARAPVERARAMGAMVTRRANGTARWGDLPGLATPVLLIHGDEDPVPVEISVEMARILPNAALVRLPGVGHFPTLERPDRVLQAITRFLPEN